jgi:hypothetical protein
VGTGSRLVESLPREGGIGVSDVGEVSVEVRPGAGRSRCPSLPGCVVTGW